MGQISQHGLLEAVQVNVDIGVDRLDRRSFRVRNLQREGKQEGGSWHGVVRFSVGVAMVCTGGSTVYLYHDAEAGS